MELPEIRVNLVEEDEWSRWSPESLGPFAADSAHEDFPSLSVENIATLLSEVVPTGRRSRIREKRWSIVRPDDLQEIAALVKSGADEFETTRLMILDANQWMYEEAATPNDRDIRKAMGVANSVTYSYLISDSWSDALRADPTEEWGSVRPEVSKRHLSDWLKLQIEYVHEEGFYDRFLLFSMHGLEDLPVFDFYVKWMEERGYNEAGILSELRQDLIAFKDDYLTVFWTGLNHLMDGHMCDLQSRLEWPKHWRRKIEEMGDAAYFEMVDYVQARRGA